MENLGKKERHRKRLVALKDERERGGWDGKWRECADFLLPDRTRFLSSDVNKADRRSRKISDGTGTFSLRTLGSGMHAGVTSPARPWFSLDAADMELRDNPAVREWLYTVAKRMRTVFHRSNIYNALPMVYEDLGCFGTSALVVLPDPVTVIRAKVLPIGSYSIGLDSMGRPDTLYREFSMTVAQMVEAFGLEACSDTVQSMYREKHFDKWVEVVHAIEPRRNRDPEKVDDKNMPYASVYFEPGAPGDKVLRESGFEEFPAMCPRWRVTGENIYGYSPGMDSLPDVKQLQLMNKEALRALQLLVKPPMNAPSSMKGKGAKMLPGDVNYTDMAGQGAAGAQPAYQIRPDIQAISAWIQDQRSRVQRHMYEDLFRLIINDSRTQPATAREIQEKHEEKMLSLGPVLENIYSDLLQPLIHRTLGIMLRMGVLPPPPSQMEGASYTVELTSVLAQAQKMVGVGSIERFAGFVGDVAQFRPEAVDRFDVDAAIEEYHEMMGAPPPVLASREEAEAARQARAQQQQAQQAAEVAKPASEAAKNLSETTVADQRALDRILGR